MMKSKLALATIALTTLLVAWCLPKNKSEQSQTTKTSLMSWTYQTYKVTSWDVFVDMVDGVLRLKNQASAISYKWWMITYLDCEEWRAIHKWDLIAKVRPDYASPATQTALNAHNSLLAQKSNLLSVIQNTAQSFDAQIQALESQKASLQEQIQIVEQNLQEQITQKQLTSGDLQSQLESLQKQLSGLQSNYQLLLQSKESQLSYISSQLDSKLASLKVGLDDFLLGVDKLFGISEDYLHANDGLEIYLAAQKPALKDQVNQLWLQINREFENRDNLSRDQKIDLVGKAGELADLVIDALDESVAWPTFPATKIQELRSAYVEASQNFHDAWWGLRSLLDQYDATASNFDSQLQSLQTQINSLQLNIANLQSNKSKQALIGADIQINSLQSQLKSLKANLSQIDSQIKSLKNQKEIQLKNLQNQLQTLDKSLKDVGINLDVEDIVSSREGVIKKRLASEGAIVGPGTPLCLIGLKEANGEDKVINFRFEEKLNVGDKVQVFDFGSGGFVWTGEIVVAYPTKDPLTRKFSYDVGGDFLQSYPEGEKFKIKVFWIQGKSGIVSIPLDFLKAKLGGYWVNKLQNWEVKQVPVVVGDIIDQKIQILSWVSVGDIIVK